MKLKLLSIITILLASLSLFAQTNILLTNEISYAVDWKWSNLSYTENANHTFSMYEGEQWTNYYDVYSNNIAMVSIDGVTDKMILCSTQIGKEAISTRLAAQAFATNYIPIK